MTACRAQGPNQSLAAMADPDLSRTLPFKEKCARAASRLHCALPSEPTLMEKLLVPSCNHWAEISPIPLGLHSWILI